MARYNEKQSEIASKRNAVLREIDSCSKSWQQNKIRRLQVLASSLANEIGRAAS